MKNKILILCTGNSCRSQMAQAIINSARGEAWEAVSAGTKPADRVNPKALQVLGEIGIHTQGSKPRHLSEYLGERFDLVVTVCDDAAENCPVWPGQGKRVHLGFPDPADAVGTEDEVLSVFREVRDSIHQKLLALVDSA
jgi:arsenate reductase